MSLLKEVGALYDTLDDPSNLEGFLTSVQSLFSGSNACLGWLDAELESKAYICSNASEELRLAYVQNLEEDPWLLASQRLPTTTLLLRGSDILRQSELRKSWLYPTYMKPMDIEHMMGSAWINSGFAVFLAINRPRTMRDFDPDDLSQLSPIAPHVVRFGHLLHQTGELRWARSLKLPMLEIGSVGVSWMNEQASRFIACGTSMKIENNRLRLRETVQNQKLQFLIYLISTHQIDKLPLETLILPFENDGQLLVFPSSRLKRNFVREHYSTILILTPKTIQPEQAINNYGLTASEAQVAIALVAGTTLKEYAKSTERSIHTVRSQLKQVFVKTKCNSQIALIRKLGGGAIKGV